MSGPATLDGLLAHHAARRPQAMALCDLAAGASCAARRLAYAQAEHAVGRTAARLRALGLARGGVVALQTGSAIDGVVALLAILRAGLVAAPLPLLWGKAEVVRALAGIDARALVTTDNADVGSSAFDIAAATFSIRHVCGLGENVPDGMVPLGDIFTDGAGGALPLAADAVAEDIAIVTFEVSAEGPLPRWRTHAALLAGGLPLVLETGFARHEVIVSTMLPASFAVLATSLVPWLLAGGTLALHRPFDPADFSRLLHEVDADLAVLPGPLAVPLAQAGAIGVAGGPNVVGLWRSPDRQPAAERWRGSTLLVDVLAFGETGLAALRREPDGAPAALKAGTIFAPSGAADALAVATLARTASGMLAMGGPMTPVSAPSAARKGNTAPIDTGLPCRIDPASGTITLGSPVGLASVGGYRLALGELQDLVAATATDGVLAALPDILAGQKLAGAAHDLDAIRRALAASGVTPLVAAAFRDRRTG